MCLYFLLLTNTHLCSHLFVILFATGATFIDPLTCSFPILPLFATPGIHSPHHHHHLIHIQSPFLAFLCCSCLSSIYVNTDITTFVCRPYIYIGLLPLQLHSQLSVAQDSSALLPTSPCFTHPNISPYALSPYPYLRYLQLLVQSICTSKIIYFC